MHHRICKWRNKEINSWMVLQLQSFEIIIFFRIKILWHRWIFTLTWHWGSFVNASYVAGVFLVTCNLKSKSHSCALPSPFSLSRSLTVLLYHSLTLFLTPSFSLLSHSHALPFSHCSHALSFSHCSRSLMLSPLSHSLHPSVHRRFKVTVGFLYHLCLKKK